MSSVFKVTSSTLSHLTRNGTTKISTTAPSTTKSAVKRNMSSLSSPTSVTANDVTACMNGRHDNRRHFQKDNTKKSFLHTTASTSSPLSSLKSSTLPSAPSLSGVTMKTMQPNSVDGTSAATTVVAAATNSNNSGFTPVLENKYHYSTTTPSYQSSASAQQQDEMKDEYGEMTADGDTFVMDEFVLENGCVLPNAQLRYQTYGELNATKDNVIVVCHALTGNASLHSWWGGLLGDGLAFDTSKYFIVCCNILGSCYGSSNPQSVHKQSDGTDVEYGMDFPDVSVQDTVRLQLHLLQDELGAQSIHSVIGGSFGGMQAMEFAVQGGRTGGDFCQDDGSPYVRSVVPIACGAAHTAWQIAISEVQRQAIYADPNWSNGDPFQATKGLEVARQMGMISYRTPQGYRGKFGREIRESKTETATTNNGNNVSYGSKANWQVKSYLEYQGIKFIDRFDPITYVKMTEQMDSHDIARNRADSVADILKQVEIPACVMGIDSDVLYPLSEQEELAEHMPNAELKIIHSDDGHDGFLLEQDQVGQYIVDFLQTIPSNSSK